MFMHRNGSSDSEEESGFERADVIEVEAEKSLTNMSEMGIAYGNQGVQGGEDGSVDQASLLPTENGSKNGDSISVSGSSMELDSVAGDSSDDRSKAVSDSNLYPSESVFENGEESTRSILSPDLSSAEGVLSAPSESVFSSTEQSFPSQPLSDETASPENELPSKGESLPEQQQESSSSESESPSTLNSSSETEPPSKHNTPTQSPKDTPLYHRKPRNTSPRTPYNDIYRNTRNSNHIARHGEFEFEQDYVVKYYEGSAPDTTPRNRSALPSYDHYDVTVISQTS